MYVNLHYELIYMVYTNEEMINEYINTRGLSKSTRNSFKYSLKHYSDFQQKSLEELIDEADEEEEKNIRWKKTKLKRRLTNYMNYCKSTMTLNSAKHYLKIVKLFYHHHDIQIHKLPPFNERNAKIRQPIMPKDLPTREILRDAVEIAEPLMKALILFLVSSGMSKIDARNLTIQNFIDATAKYHDNSKDLKTAIEKMKEYDGEIIPVWNSRRQKTKKFFITFNSDEATRHIINYLELRNQRVEDGTKGAPEELKPSDKLFKISSEYFTIKFRELNDALELGTVGDDEASGVKGYNRLRGHMLRKYHATNLKNAGMDVYSINVLQGKSNGTVNDVYFFEDEQHLLKEYIDAIEGVLILTDVKELNRYSPEYVKMEKQNEEYKKQLDEIKSDIDGLKKVLGNGK